LSSSAAIAAIPNVSLGHSVKANRGHGAVQGGEGAGRAVGFRIYSKINDQLNIGIETVRTYVKNIYEKMHVWSRVEAVAKHGGKAA